MWQARLIKAFARSVGLPKASVTLTVTSVTEAGRRLQTGDGAQLTFTGTTSSEVAADGAQSLMSTWSSNATLAEAALGVTASSVTVGAVVTAEAGVSQPGPPPPPFAPCLATDENVGYYWYWQSTDGAWHVGTTSDTWGAPYSFPLNKPGAGPRKRLQMVAYADRHQYSTYCTPS